MNAIEQKAEALQAKRKSVFAIVTEKPDYNWTADELKDFQQGQVEIDALTKEYEALAAAAASAEGLKAAMEAADRPAPMRFGDGTKSAPVSALYPGAPLAVENPTDLGHLFVTSAAFKNYRPGGGTQTLVSDVPFTPGVKTTLTETGYTIQNIRIPKLVDYALRRPMVADLISDGETGGNAVVYMEETTFTNAADAVAEGGQKPEGALAFTERTATVRKIAVVLPVTDELMADAPAMRSYINARLETMIKLKEETELISGSGTPPHITGMLNAANLQTQAKGSDPTPDAIFKAMMLIETAAFVPATGVIFHPLDWQDVRLLRTAAGQYIWGNPSEAGPERIWGLPVIVTTAMTQNTALVADFRTSMQIFRRQGITLETTNSHSTDFDYNLLRIRAEERLAFAIYRGAAICQVTGV